MWLIVVTGGKREFRQRLIVLVQARDCVPEPVEPLILGRRPSFQGVRSSDSGDTGGCEFICRSLDTANFFDNLS